MAEGWIRADVEAECRGRPTRGPGGSSSARWYELTIASAVLRSATTVDGPPPSAPDGRQPFRQPHLRRCTVIPADADAAPEERSLVDVRICDWEMKDHLEVGGQTQGRLVGTLYARPDPTRTPVARRPRPAIPAAAPLAAHDRIGRLGCLALILALLVAAWLWWHCGAFTCLFWAAAIGASAWVSSRQRRREESRGRLKVVLHGLAGLALVGLAIGVMLDVADAQALSTCAPADAIRVLLVALSLVGAALLTVVFPLRWLWMLWTVVMLLWCGRSGTDCVGGWAGGLGATLRGAAPDMSFLAPQIARLRRTLGIGGAGEGAGAGTGDGTGARDGAGAGVGAGAGAGAGDGAAAGAGAGAAPSSGDSGGARPGAGRRGGAGAGDGDDGAAGGLGGSRDGADSGGRGKAGGAGAPGARPPRGPADAEAPLAPDAAEPRLSVEQALQNPDLFYGSPRQRVSLSGDLLFSFDETGLRPEAEPKLRQVARLLRMNPEKRIILEGHADTIGGDTYNQRLSERRAEAVRSWLVQEGHINPGQVDTAGYGSSRPLVPRSRGPAAQQPNRRVEVRVVRPGETPRASTSEPGG